MHDLTLTNMLRQARIDALEEAARVCAAAFHRRIDNTISRASRSRSICVESPCLIR